MTDLESDRIVSWQDGKFPSLQPYSAILLFASPAPLQVVLLTRALPSDKMPYSAFPFYFTSSRDVVSENSQLTMFTRRIRISLQVPYDDDGAPFFRPGAILSGQVSYKAPTSDRVSSITVDFRGESQVDSDKIELFHRQYVIKDDSSNYLDINSRQTYDFPFQFTAPEMTELDCTNGYPTSSPESFVDSHHPLPPSFGADQSRHAKIVYVIYATVTRVSSVGGYRYHLPATHSISNLKCLHTTLPRYEAIQPEPLGWFKQPMVESPVPQNSKTQPDAEVGALPVYQAVINVPSTAVLGEKIPLISIICPKDHQPDCRIYAVDLSFSVSVSLQAETHSRHKSLTGCPPITEIKALPLKTELPCTSTTAVGSPQSVGCCTKAAVSWPPSYKSYLVSRSYNLVVDISVNKKGSKANHIAHFQVPISVSVPQHSHLNRVLDYDERVPLGRGQVAMYDEEPPAYDSLRS